MIKDKTITEVKTFNLTCRYIDDVLSINNSLHNIAEILLKLELNTNQSINQLKDKRTTDSTYSYIA